MEEPAIGEAVSEADIERTLQSDCECRDGMFPRGRVGTGSRRAFLRGTGIATAAAAIVPVRAMAADDGDARWSLPGAIAKSDYGSRAGTEKVMRLASQGGTSA